MHKQIYIQFLLVVFLLNPYLSFSDTMPGSISITPLISGYVFEGNEPFEGDHMLGLGLSYHFNKHMSVELMGHYGDFTNNFYDKVSHTCKQKSMDSYVFHLNSTYQFNSFKTIFPYISAGAGLINLNHNTDDKTTYPLVNYGAGFHYLITQQITFRSEFRHLITWNNTQDSHYNNFIYSLGISFYFGKQQPGKIKKVIPEPVKHLPIVPKKEIVQQPEIKKPEKKEETKVVEIDQLEIATIEKEISIDLNITFDVNSCHIKPEHHVHIKKVADFMKKYTQTEAIIEGYTCDIGPLDINLKLSQQRADNVRLYLIKQFNIDPRRIKAKGYGERNPVADNTTEKGRIKNRRVITIIKAITTIQKKRKRQ